MCAFLQASATSKEVAEKLYDTIREVSRSMGGVDEEGGGFM